MFKPVHKFLWFGGSMIACGVSVWLFGAQIFFVLQARRIGREVPVVNSIPVELGDLSVTQSKGQKLSFQGAEFEIPWNDIEESQTRIVGNCARMLFGSGNSLTLCVGPPDSFMSNLFKDQKAEPSLFTGTYGQAILHSDYSLMKAVYETTPRSITLFTPTRNAAGLASIMVIKAVTPPMADSEIFNVRSKNFQGFQLGNPLRRPAKMCLQLYADDIEFEFNFQQTKAEQSPAITQADLNRIIQTAHFTAHPRAIVEVNPG